MRNKERIILSIISEIFSHKKFTIPLLIILGVYFFGFRTTQSQLICNNGNCEIQNKNRIGITFKTKKINFSEIENFDYKNDYDWYRAYTRFNKRYATAERRFEDAHRNNQYVIIAKNKNAQNINISY